MLDKIILSALFVGLAIYERTEYYFFHIIGMALVILINFFLLRLDTNLLVTTFTLSFGLISIFGYKHNSDLYKLILILIGLQYGYSAYKVMTTITLKIVVFAMAVSVSLALGYVYLLDNLGIKLEQEDEKKKDEEEEPDHICALYKDNRFVNFV